MKRYTVRNKARFISAIGIIIIVMSSFFTLAVSARFNQSVLMVAEYVEEGDTLWNMSQKYTGEYISRVMEINDLHDANIKPGELLYFPSLK
mgnify:CR=1 FL=1